MTMRIAGRFWLISAAVAAGVAATNVRAEEGVLMKNLLGDMGIISKEKDPIRYRERAPLVLPPKMELREPAARESFASSNPQWPKDPDVVAQKRRLEANAVPVTESETRRMSERNSRLSIDEMRTGRSASAERGYPGTHRGDNARDVLLLSPDEMRAKRSNDDEVKTADGTPLRRTLTDPPSTFRKPTGAPARTDYQFRGDKQAYDANPLNWMLDKFKGSSDDD